MKKIYFTLLLISATCIIFSCEHLRPSIEEKVTNLVNYKSYEDYGRLRENGMIVFEKGYENLNFCRNEEFDAMSELGYNCYYGNAQYVKIMLDKGTGTSFEPNNLAMGAALYYGEKVASLDDVLLLATKGGQLDVVKLIAAKDTVSLNRQYGDCGMTLLNYSINNKGDDSASYELVKFYLEKGIDVNGGGLNGVKVDPLEDALMCGKAKTATLLLTKGKDVSFDTSGGHLLQLAARMDDKDGAVEVVKLLLKRDLYIDVNGLRLAIQFAIDRKNKELLEIFDNIKL